MGRWNTDFKAYKKLFTLEGVWGYAEYIKKIYKEGQMRFFTSVQQGFHTVSSHATRAKRLGSLQLWAMNLSSVAQERGTMNLAK